MFLSGTPTVTPRGAPVLGEHARAVLRDVLRYDASRIETLARASALGPAAGKAAPRGSESKNLS